MISSFKTYRYEENTRKPLTSIETKKEIRPQDGSGAQDQEGDPLPVCDEAVHAQVLLNVNPHVRDRTADGPLSRGLRWNLFQYSQGK